MTTTILKFLGHLIAHIRFGSMSVHLNILICTGSIIYECSMAWVRRPHISWCQQKALITLHNLIASLKTSFCLN